MKQCNKCNETKSLSEFTQSGLKINKCKVCIQKTNLENRKGRDKWGAGVYAIIRKSDCKTVYIGETKSLYNRKTEHFNNGKNAKCSFLVKNNLNPAEYEFAILNRIEDPTWRKRLENIYIQTLGLPQKLNVL